MISRLLYRLRLSFRQMLVSEAGPSLRIDYDIDLTEQYFCKRGR